jgi:hypothetical protein
LLTSKKSIEKRTTSSGKNIPVIRRWVSWERGRAQIPSHKKKMSSAKNSG